MYFVKITFHIVYVIKFYFTSTDLSWIYFYCLCCQIYQLLQFHGQCFRGHPEKVQLTLYSFTDSVIPVRDTFWQRLYCSHTRSKESNRKKNKKISSTTNPKFQLPTCLQYNSGSVSLHFTSVVYLTYTL